MSDDDYSDDLDDDVLLALTQHPSSEDGGIVSRANHTSSRHGNGSLGAPDAPRRPPQSQSLQQQTLFGTAASISRPSQPTSQARRAYRSDQPPEIATSHILNHEALKTWVYPTNLGPTRDYQFSIVKSALFANTLVALPTGLGKTFIAATVMLNFHRWTKDAKIIFVAPTKPLAAQQVEACLNVAGIPRSQTTLLTGEIAASLREGEWAKRRLFFMTPQTLQNDLSKGYADPKSIALLVIDEAHRATGNYAYVKVVEFLRRFNHSFRVLALTATPGSKVEGVQAVIDSLGIATIEIRTEDSIDIRQYVHQRAIDTVVLEPSDEMLHVQDLFSQALKPICEKLALVNQWIARDPMSLNTMVLRENQRQWNEGAGKHANQGQKFMVNAIFAILQSLAHSIKLLNYHGIAPFYNKLVDFRAAAEEKGERGSKYKRQIVESEPFQEMMDKVKSWTRSDDFVGHPKLSYLRQTLLTHFMDAGAESNTRAIVFSEYRDSAEEIVRCLDQHKPMVKATIFVGQADSSRSAGMKQKQQIETIDRFKEGKFNVLVATSIGEEGLDIGQVDLIICYDASASPIRMLQRMGRTGRKRAGNITLLLMKGKEEANYAKANDNYEKMQRFICDGSRFTFRHDLSHRILPRDAKPTVDQRLVDIPIENSQDKSLPIPKKGNAIRKKKTTAKKFHMPDGVETGFAKASFFGKPDYRKKSLPVPTELDSLAELPELCSVVLDKERTAELFRNYQNIPLGVTPLEEVMAPGLALHTKHQRKARTTVHVGHGAHTRSCISLFKRLHKLQTSSDSTRPFDDADETEYQKLPMPPFAEDTDRDELDAEVATTQKRDHVNFDEDSDAEIERPAKRKRAAPVEKVSSARRRTGINPYLLPDDAMSSDNDSEESEEESSEEPADSRGRKYSAGKMAGAAWNRRNPDNIDDFGDDCTRTSQLYEKSDDSDSGSDLLDFVANDSEPIEEAPTSSTSFSTASLHSHQQDGTKYSKSHCLTTRDASSSVRQRNHTVLLSSEAGDDDLPNLSQLASLGQGGCLNRGSHVRRQRADFVGLESSSPPMIARKPAPGRASRRRQTLEDSDSD